MNIASEMRQASEDDVIDIIDLLEESSAWMISIGIDRWQPGAHAAAEQQLRNEVKRGNVYVWKPLNALFATIRLTGTDEAIWPNDSTAALYIHKMSVRRSLKGRGLGKLLLQWAEQRATRDGVDRLRLDCWAENQRLCKFYLSCGFQPIRTVIVQGWNHQLFERRIGKDSTLVTGGKS